VVRRDRLLHAVELDHHRALVDPRLVYLRGVAAHQVAPARRLQSGGGDLRVGSERIGVLDRVITDYPIGLGHRSFLSWWVSPAPEGSIITGRGQRPPDPAAGAGPFRTPELRLLRGAIQYREKVQADEVHDALLLRESALAPQLVQSTRAAVSSGASLRLAAGLRFRTG